MTNLTESTTQSDETELWFAANGAAMMRSLGVQLGDYVVDFGCGPGRYVVPLSQVVGPSGRVYAIERESEAIETTEKRLTDFGTSSIVQIFPTDSLKLPHAIADGCIDTCFLFDVLQYVSDWGILFSALRKALKSTGRLHVYPAALPHPGSVDIDRVIEQLRHSGFECAGHRTFRMMHNVHFLEDTVYSFGRV